MVVMMVVMAMVMVVVVMVRMVVMMIVVMVSMVIMVVMTAFKKESYQCLVHRCFINVVFSSHSAWTFSTRSIFSWSLEPPFCTCYLHLN